MNDVQIFWSLCAECIEFLTQMRRGDVLMESRHGEGQTDKQVPQRKPRGVKNKSNKCHTWIRTHRASIKRPNHTTVKAAVKG